MPVRTLPFLKTLLRLAAFVAALSLCPAQAAETPIQTSVRSALLIDPDTNTILFEKAPDEVMAPASLTKIMSLAVVFQEISEGRLKPDQEVVISQEAWRRGGAPSRTSSMFVVPNSRVKVMDLVRGVAIQSGNDATIALAEAVAGSEGAFSGLMNKKVRDLGLPRSQFGNATGLPEGNNKSTARELAKLTDILIRSYPDLYKVFSEKEFTWNNIKQASRNPLLPLNIGADGLMTGYLEESGYGLVGSAVQNNQRLIVVVLGAKSIAERSSEARKLLEWGFHSFEPKPLFAENEVIGEASVFGGSARKVPMTAQKSVKILLPRGSTERLTARITYSGPLLPPVQKGQFVGQLKIFRGQQVALEQPVYAAADVGEGNLQQKALSGLIELSGQIMRAGLSRP